MAPSRGRSSALALLLAAASAGPAEAACCPPSVVAEHDWPAGSTGVSVAADSLGGVYGAFAGPASTRELVVSRDFGASFEPFGSAPFEDSFSGVVAASAGGVVALAWAGADAVRVRVSADQGRSWGAAVVALSGVNDARFGGWEPGFGLVVDDGGRVGLAYTYLREQFPDLVAATAVTGSPDFGATWGEPFEWASLSVVAHGAQQLALSGGVLVAASLPGGEATASRSLDGGLSWSAPVEIDGPLGSRTVALTATGGGRFQAAFTEASVPGRVRVIVSSDAGASWPADTEVVGTMASTDGTPWIAGAPDGTLVVAGWPEPGGGIGARISLEHGLSWSAPPGRFAEGGERVHHVRAVALSPARAVAVHDDYRDEGDCPDPAETCESIYFQQSCEQGSDWPLNERRLDSDEPGLRAHSEDPELAVGAGGLLHLLFTDHAASQFRARYLAFRMETRAPGPVPGVGWALRVGEHGPARAPVLSAVLDWSLDPARPRPAGQHYHLRRSLDPAALEWLEELEPLVAPVLLDETPSGGGRRQVHYYRVSAADACDVESGS